MKRNKALTYKRYNNKVIELHKVINIFKLKYSAWGEEMGLKYKEMVVLIN